MKNKKTILKERDRLLDEFNKYKNMKSKNLDSESLASILKARKSQRDVKILKVILTYLRNKDIGMKINIRSCVEVLAFKQHPFDAKVKISKSTFQRELEYYKKHKRLKPHGNKGRAPANKISDLEREELIDTFDWILALIEKFHGGSVPMTISAIFHFVKKEYKKKNKKVPVTLRTFARWVSGQERYFISKYTNKRRRRILRKLARLTLKIKAIEELLKQAKESKSETKETKIKLDYVAMVNKDRIRRKQSPLRNLSQAGTVVQWDSSEEKFYKGKKVHRMHAIDERTLYTEGIAFVKHENNRGYINLLRKILKNGKPSLIKCDRRKGVDPADENALIANICQLLGITIYARSSATHKADIERINGPTHALFNGIVTYKNWTSLSTLEKNEDNMLKEINSYFSKEKPDYSHLEKASELEWKMLDAKKHFVITFNSYDAFIHKKKLMWLMTKRATKLN